MAALASSCDEFLVHGVDVEGMKLGIDEELVRRLGEHSPIPVTYAGGARSIADLELVRGAGGAAVDVTVGSAACRECFDRMFRSVGDVASRGWSHGESSKLMPL